MVSEDGQDHNKTYNVSVALGETILAMGKGSSKKKSEQDAAENAIQNRSHWENIVSVPRKIL